MKITTCSMSLSLVQEAGLLEGLEVPARPPHPCKSIEPRPEAAVAPPIFNSSRRFMSRILMFDFGLPGGNGGIPGNADTRPRKRLRVAVRSDHALNSNSGRSRNYRIGRIVDC